MKSIVILIALFISALPSTVLADNSMSSEISVVASAVATDIVDREPMGASGSFTNYVEQLYCYSKIKNGNGDSIHHKWYYGDQLMADVTLNIKSDLFRTKSSKRIIPQWIGAWHVDITDSDGKVLETLDFTIN